MLDCLGVRSGCTVPVTISVYKQCGQYGLWFVCRVGVLSWFTVYELEQVYDQDVLSVCNQGVWPKYTVSLYGRV